MIKYKMARKFSIVKPRKTALETHEEAIIPDVLNIPDAVRFKRATVKSLSSGNYQKKIMAALAPDVLIRAFNSLMHGLEEGDPVCRKQALEIYSVLQTKSGSGITVNTNVNQDARTASVSMDARKGIADFDDIVRMVQEDRKVIDVRNQESLPTPEGSA